jgi:flagellar hook-associated protein 3 FlgL
MRITNSIIFNTAIENLQNQHQRLFRIQEEAASGKKILQLSDDPVKVNRIFDFRQKLASIDQFQQNQEHINSFLGATEDALQGVESVLQTSKELTLSGLNDALKAEDRMAIARELKELIGQAVQLGNTEFAGRFIFAGTTEQSEPPFSDTGQFSGNSQALSLEIAPDHTLPMNILGSQFLTSDLRPCPAAAARWCPLRRG